jgi:hypothetical protein
VDGKVAATWNMEHTQPMFVRWDENLDVGSDTGTPVDVLGVQITKSYQRRT